MSNKKFKVLFIYPNTMMATLVPIHLSLLSACLKEKSFEVDLFDTTYYKTEEVNFEQKKVELLQIKPFNLNDKGIGFKQTDIYEDLVKKVAEYKPDLIGITIVEDTYDLSRALLESIKSFDVPVIAGGVFVTFSPEEVISNENVDMVCVGEGEEALVELCEKMSNGQDYTDVQNLWIKEDDKIIKNSLRTLTDINKLPVIDYDIFGRERLYRPMFGKVFTMIHVELDRGCPYDCTYCEAPHLRKLFQESGCGIYYRKKNIDTVMREMKFLADKYSPDYVNFNSETFLAKPVSELKKFAERYKEINIPFWCQTRPETVTEEKIKILKDMNCDSLQFGIEHGNEKFRANILRRYSSNEKVVNALKIVEKYKIPYTVNNIIGFPDETRELVFDTINVNREINPRTMNCYLFTPYKGTVLYKQCVEKGYLGKFAKVHQLLDSVKLNMDSISYDELKGLQRTFSLYVRLPKTEWDKIRIAEKFDEEGNRMFKQLAEKYREEYFR
ncbi:MAG: radical SAM protein [Candidatus Omnitrophota bacterium]